MIIDTLNCLITCYVGWSVHVHYYYILGNRELIQQLEAIENEKHIAEDHNREKTSSTENVRMNLQHVKNCTFKQ